MDLTIVGEVADVEVIAKGRGIQRLKILRKRYGGKNWRKMKGLATIRTMVDRQGGLKCIGTKLMASAAKDGR